MISNPALTSKWFEGSNYVQVIEMTVTNNHTHNSLTLADTLNITATSSSFDLVNTGTLTRRHPGQSAVVQIGVKTKREWQLVLLATVSSLPLGDPHMGHRSPVLRTFLECVDSATIRQTHRVCRTTAVRIGSTKPSSESSFTGAYIQLLPMEVWHLMKTMPNGKGRSTTSPEIY